MTRSASLPPWAVDEATSIRREAAPYRGMSPAERARVMSELCRGAARQLAHRHDRARLLDYQDPLPASTVAALARLRKR